MYLTTAVACCSGLKSFLGGPLLTLRLLFLSLVCSRCVLYLIHSFVRSIALLRFVSFAHRRISPPPLSRIVTVISSLLIDFMFDHHPHSLPLLMRRVSSNISIYLHLATVSHPAPLLPYRCFCYCRRRSSFGCLFCCTRSICLPSTLCGLPACLFFLFFFSRSLVIKRVHRSPLAERYIHLLHSFIIRHSLGRYICIC